MWESEAEGIWTTALVGGGHGEDTGRAGPPEGGGGLVEAGFRARPRLRFVLPPQTCIPARRLARWAGLAYGKVGT